MPPDDPHLTALLDRVRGPLPQPPAPSRNARRRGDAPPAPVDRWRWICAGLDGCPPALIDAGYDRLDAALTAALGAGHYRPIPTAWLDRLADGAPCPAARLARAVTLGALTADRSLDALERLVGRPELDGLIRLHITGQASEEALLCLGAYGRLAGLRHVDAVWQPWLGWRDELDWLLGAPWARRLDSLDLSESLLDGVDALLRHPDASIGALSLVECWLTQAQVTALLQWPAIARMRRLDVRLNGVQDPAAALAASPHLHPDLTLVGLPPVPGAPCAMLEWG